ncbi:prephenate dehydrogenase [Bacillus sp. 165]|uniref:prephenate dehydrogenase n=1 Tax=Bacillus sp. 165 TaxID=1529117 RepID=UPI001ADC6C4D|nr:prephenate dehydrogenase [Bacillus sp. 165]
MKKHVLLIGTGLIGGSVALAIRKEHKASITGYDVNIEHCKLAKMLHIIDEYTENLQEAAEQADLIILAAPVQETENILEELVAYSLKKGVLITDVGSTKSKIMEKAKLLEQRSTSFIGGHPMAGSHKTGAGSAKAHLFENAFYILTPLASTPVEAVDDLKHWLKGTNAKFVIMDAKEHDALTGVVSHFPHLIASSLVRQVQAHAEQNELVKALAAGGFRDITRIASSSPSMWRDIIIHNKHNMLSLLDEWQEEMNTIRKMVEKADGMELHNYFLGAKTYRDSLPQRTKGAIPAFYDLYVDVLDRPGVISDVTTLLAKENISITNIRIIEAREDVFGVLRLSFQTEDDRTGAKRCLEISGYETYITM